jgi:hypothetical protein
MDINTHILSQTTSLLALHYLSAIVQITLLQQVIYMYPSHSTHSNLAFNLLNWGNFSPPNQRPTHNLIDHFMSIYQFYYAYDHLQIQIP